VDVKKNEMEKGTRPSPISEDESRARKRRQTRVFKKKLYVSKVRGV